MGITMSIHRFNKGLTYVQHSGFTLMSKALIKVYSVI